MMANHLEFCAKETRAGETECRGHRSESTAALALKGDSPDTHAHVSPRYGTQLTGTSVLLGYSF